MIVFSNTRHVFFAGDTQATAEQSSSFSTKEILGYLWPKEILKKHGKEIPKRLQTIQHQGKQVKGVIMEDWVLGTFPFIYGVQILFDRIRLLFVAGVF